MAREGRIAVSVGHWQVEDLVEPCDQLGLRMIWDTLVPMMIGVFVAHEMFWAVLRLR